MEQQTAEFEASQTAVKETFYHFFVHLQMGQLGRCHPIKTGGLPRMDTSQAGTDFDIRSGSYGGCECTRVAKTWETRQLRWRLHGRTGSKGQALNASLSEDVGRRTKNCDANPPFAVQLDEGSVALDNTRLAPAQQGQWIRQKPSSLPNIGDARSCRIGIPSRILSARPF